MFVHTKSPANTNLSIDKEERNISKKTETSCQPAQSMLIMFKPVLGTRYILSTYLFLSLLKLSPSQSTQPKDETGAVELMVSYLVIIIVIIEHMYICPVYQELYMSSLNFLQLC